MQRSEVEVKKNQDPDSPQGPAEKTHLHLPLIKIEKQRCFSSILYSVQAISGAIHHRPGGHRRSRPLDNDFAGALREQQKLLLRVRVRRVRLGPWFKTEAACGHRLDLIGGPLEIDMEFAEWFMNDFGVPGRDRLVSERSGSRG